VSDQHDRIHQLEAQVASLTDKLESLLASDPAPRPAGIEPVPASQVETVPSGPPTGSRRNLLKLAAGAAAGGAVVAASNTTGRVAAADGEAVTAGETTTTTAGNRNDTVLAYTNTTGGPQTTGVVGTTAANVFLARDTPSGIFPIGQDASAYPAAVAGYARNVIDHGMYGYSSTPAGVGVVGFGAGAATGLLARGGRANAEFYNDGDAPPARSDEHSRGEIIADGDGILWYCTVAGTPGTWQRLGAAGTAGALTLIAPVRVYDSREGQQPLGVVKGPLSPGENRAVDCTFNSSGVPSNAAGVVLNLTAASPVAVGNLAVYPDGTPAPSTSTLNYQPGMNIANSTISGCGPGAIIQVQCGPTGVGATDFVVDISGYYL